MCIPSSCRIMREEAKNWSNSPVDKSQNLFQSQFKSVIMSGSWDVDGGVLLVAFSLRMLTAGQLSCPDDWVIIFFLFFLDSSRNCNPPPSTPAGWVEGNDCGVNDGIVLTVVGTSGLFPDLDLDAPKVPKQGAIHDLVFWDACFFLGIASSVHSSWLSSSWIVQATNGRCRPWARAILIPKTKCHKKFDIKQFSLYESSANQKRFVDWLDMVLLWLFLL